MDRDEILARSRNEKKDEGLLTAQDQGRKIGITAFSIMFIFITLFNLFTGQSNDAPMGMFWAFLAAEAYPQYKFTQSKAHLVTVIAGSLASLLFLANYVIRSLG